MPTPDGHIDRRRELLLEWEQRTRARGAPGSAEHCSGADALFLVTALAGALRRTSETPELGRAARTWGARFSSPVEALANLSMLRDSLIDLASDRADGLPVPHEVLNRVLDQVSLEAVDAASGNLRVAARSDVLTGCANRRALEEDLGHAVASARRSNLDLAVAVIDLDGLKQINDGEGHAAGDAALTSLVISMRQALREADTLYRTGGDEFVVVAPFTDAAGGRALMRRAERMGGPDFSWGIASLAETGLIPAHQDQPVAEGTEHAAVLLEAADANLYDRRRATRRAASLAARRRRVTTVASVAASVAVTAGAAGLAAALGAGGSTPGSHNVRAAERLSPAASASRWPAAGAPSAGSPRGLLHGTFGAPGVDTPASVSGGGGAGDSLIGLLGTLSPPSVSLPVVTVPVVTLPTATVPALPIPTVTTPVLSVPTVTTPVLSVPTVTTPVPSVPTVTAPVAPVVTVAVTSTPVAGPGPGSSSAAQGGAKSGSGSDKSSGTGSPILSASRPDSQSGTGLSSTDLNTANTQGDAQGKTRHS
ncbi:MAG: GGDEF domain-containing protein [Acidimicrobiales bacterium]